MQAQLTSANAQILALAQMLELVPADQGRLRRESEHAYSELQRNESQLEFKPRGIASVNQRNYKGGSS